ncbi:hypothetical protein [Naasia sp. SYSU D00948]|uniref:hypothetical protein n=1 Tax=Naasia sp. SYSU D00948 TaxID=2817379 RepID=UPI001FEFDF26|nr:hypothetical protein [Naasia sp. SYSU D00948]
MTASIVSPPSFLPTLSAGRHRNPKRGACFMEYASFLAGERWSDHPGCTHPVLGTIARGVNDFISDGARDGLLPLVPRVVGLSGSDPRIAFRVALRAVVGALPVASMERQRALGVGARHALEELRRLGDDDPEVRQRVADAFAMVPDAEEWSRRFCDSVGHSSSRSPVRTGEAMATVAVLGVAEACIPDVDTALRNLLQEAVDETERTIERLRPSAPTAVPREPVAERR